MPVVLSSFFNIMLLVSILLVSGTLLHRLILSLISSRLCRYYLGCVRDSYLAGSGQVQQVFSPASASSFMEQLKL